jgi:hypothetical protein
MKKHILKAGSLNVYATSPTFENLPAPLREALSTMAKLVWAEDIELGEELGQWFNDSRNEAVALLASYDVFHNYSA